MRLDSSARSGLAALVAAFALLGSPPTAPAAPRAAEPPALVRTLEDAVASPPALLPPKVVEFISFG